MQEPDISTSVILLGACVAFLFVILMVLVGIRAQMGRIERLLAAKKEPTAVLKPTSSTPATLSAAESSPGGAFEAFLDEDPVRKGLSKKEQAAAYRKWRQENGMNWSNS